MYNEASGDDIDPKARTRSLCLRGVTSTTIATATTTTITLSVSLMERVAEC